MTPEATRPCAGGCVATSSTDRTVIEPTKGWAPLRLGELWRYRELIYFLTWRDIKVRYKQTVVGVGWVIVQPVASTIVFTLVFGRVAHLPSDGVPYALFTFSALLPWSYFSYVLQQAGNSLVSNTAMISRVYFPRLALPASVAVAGLMDLATSFGVFIIMMLCFHIGISAHVLLLPLFLLFAVTASVAVGIWVAALSAEYRDVKYVLPFVTQIWLYASPVAYSPHLVTGKAAIIYALNPLTGVIQGFRWTLLGVGGPPGWTAVPSVVVTLLLLVSGLFFFRRMEQTFADVI